MVWNVCVNEGVIYKDKKIIINRKRGYIELWEVKKMYECFMWIWVGTSSGI